MAINGIENNEEAAKALESVSMALRSS